MADELEAPAEAGAGAGRRVRPRGRRGRRRGRARAGRRAGSATRPRRSRREARLRPRLRVFPPRPPAVPSLWTGARSSRSERTIRPHARAATWGRRPPACGGLRPTLRVGSGTDVPFPCNQGNSRHRHTRGRAPLRRAADGGAERPETRSTSDMATAVAATDAARVPPQNLEAEEHVLGAMLLSPGAIGAVSEVLVADRLLPRDARHDLPHGALPLREGRARRRDHRHRRAREARRARGVGGRSADPRAREHSSRRRRTRRTTRGSSTRWRRSAA